MDSDATRLVLAIDDEPVVLELVRTALEEGGFEVKTAADGAHAIPIIEEISLDALVTDISIGGEPDGWGVAKRGREANASLAVVYMSGAHESDWASMGVPKSVLVKKPFAPAQIVAAVATLINEMQEPVVR